jgi:hypothetical protein
MTPDAVGELAVDDGLAWPPVKPMMAPPSRRYDKAPVHRFDSTRVLGWIARVFTNPIPASAPLRTPLRPEQVGAQKELIMQTPNVTQIPGVAFPASAQQRREVFWRLSPIERIALMRAGELTLKECCQWAARAPHEVPIVNGEFEFIAASTPEAREH